MIVIKMFDDGFSGFEPIYEWTLKENSPKEKIKEGITNLLINEWDCIDSQWWQDKEMG